MDRLRAMKNIPRFQEIADEITKMIDAATFNQGCRILSERELAKQFDVSRRVIREAQIALQSQGYLEIRPSSGVYVIHTCKFRFNGIPKFTPLELMQARALIEPESAALAASIITDESLQKLEKLIKIMSAEENSNMTSHDAYAAFHRAIACSTNNDVIMLILDSTWKIEPDVSGFQDVYRKVYDNNQDVLRYEHITILEALRNRDSAQARKSTRAHYTRIIDTILKTSEEKDYEDVKHKMSKIRNRFLLCTQLH